MRLVFAKTALITGLITTIAWLVATFVTKPESTADAAGLLQAGASDGVWMEAYCAARARDAGGAGPGGQHLQLGDGSDPGLWMPVRHRQTRLPAMVLGNLLAIACRSCWLSDLLGSFSARVGHAFWNNGSRLTGGDARAYFTSVKGYGFFGVKSQAFFTRPGRGRQERSSQSLGRAGSRLRL